MWIIYQSRPGGYQVAPADLDGCLFDHPDISDACLVGIPDDYSGEIPLPFVVLNAVAAKGVESDPQAAQRIKASVVKVILKDNFWILAANKLGSILKFVANRRVEYRHLSCGEFIDMIPRNSSGKLLRRLLLRDRAKHWRMKAQAKL
jgi:acyl-coenzyme A synthetase/AMP-(fatty) acid ligase